jgi:hypothetical protein
LKNTQRAADWGPVDWVVEENRTRSLEVAYFQQQIDQPSGGIGQELIAQ